MLQATADPAIVRQLETLEEQLASTWKNRDCAGWSGLLADDWTVTHINAQVITKTQALEMCRTGPAVTSSLDQIRGTGLWGYCDRSRARQSDRSEHTAPNRCSSVHRRRRAAKRPLGRCGITRHATSRHTVAIHSRLARDRRRRGDLRRLGSLLATTRPPSRG